MEWEELSPEERLLLLRGALLGWAHGSADGLKRLPPRKPDPRGEDVSVTLGRVRERWCMALLHAEALVMHHAWGAMRQESRVKPIKEWKGGRG